MFKSFKNFIRKAIFHPLGYDLVPLRKGNPTTPTPTEVSIAPESKKDLLTPYIEAFGQQAVRERRFYNVGAEASFSHPAWTVINHPSEHYGADYMDMQWDLMSGEPLPIESGKAYVIFSRYTLEHVTDQAVAHFFEEARRAIVKGGYLRVIVPDIDLYYAAYQMKDSAFFHKPKQERETFPNRKYLSNPNLASFEQKFLWNFASNTSTLHPDPDAKQITDEELRKAFKEMSYEQALDQCTSKASLEIQRRCPENHVNWFNATKLERMIRQAGFQEVYRSGYGQSHMAVLRDVNLLEARQPEVGLFFEAVR